MWNSETFDNSHRDKKQARLLSKGPMSLIPQQVADRHRWTNSEIHICESWGVPFKTFDQSNQSQNFEIDRKSSRSKQRPEKGIDSLKQKSSKFCDPWSTLLKKKSFWNSLQCSLGGGGQESLDQ